ncbi:MAG TPA: hypothetical protein VGJ05_00315 [Fimbriiglobus sp.]|jgi:hypothetical protein
MGIFFTVLFFCMFGDDPKGTRVAFGKVSAAVPSTWKVEKPANRLRSHQFRLPSADKNYADGEVAVYPEGRPDPAKVFPDWKNQFEPPDAKTLDEVTKTDKWTVGPATIHLLDVTGTWNYKERPKDPKSKLEVRPEYRSIWAIVVVGDDAWHVRFSGPQSVVAKYKPGFDAWLKGLK